LNADSDTAYTPKLDPHELMTSARRQFIKGRGYLGASRCGIMPYATAFRNGPCQTGVPDHHPFTKDQPLRGSRPQLTGDEQVASTQPL
jgi:hypothetical protein